jgi:hypothetical protein
LFDGGDQFHGHIERAGAAARFEGQVPAWLGAAGAFEGREAAFDERTKRSDLLQSGLALAKMPVRNDRAGVHRMGGSRGTQEGRWRFRSRGLP